ncbi:MAG: UDP-galactopyranose mutase [Bacteroidaceae bacterium]|nr:UDP-galactopyranose mutase [Bacteroidaceae bacterium]
MMFDYLIVGSGLYGATFAYKARQAGKNCLVIDRRSYLGGNVRCETVEGINVHCHGPHIFHTDNRKVWDFVNSFVEFNRFIHSPLASYQGRLYNLPFNMNTFYQMWGVTTPEEARKRMGKTCRLSDTNLEEYAISIVGQELYEAFIKGYTEKQWGRSCRELPSKILRRLPVRFVYDNNYYNNRYQGIPIGGYNKLINGLLKGVETRTNADFFDNRHEWESVAKQIVYTGPLDQFFDYKLGHLEWRSVTFEQEVLPVPNYQGVAVVNYTERNVPYTRIIEHKHFEMFGDEVEQHPTTVISREYPKACRLGVEPYYPVNDQRNSVLADQYRNLAAQEKNVIFGGRLAEYKYYDMDTVVEKALLTPNS